MRGEIGSIPSARPRPARLRAVAAQSRHHGSGHRRPLDDASLSRARRRLRGQRHPDLHAGAGNAAARLAALAVHRLGRRLPRRAPFERSSMPAVPRNIALPWMLNSKTDMLVNAGPFAAFLGQAHDPVWTDFTGTGTRTVPRYTDGQTKDFHDPFGGTTAERALHPVARQSPARRHPRRALEPAAIAAEPVRAGTPANRHAGPDPRPPSAARLQPAHVERRAPGARHRPRADAAAREVRHDAVRPGVPGGPAAGRGGQQVRHASSGTATASSATAPGTRTTTTIRA